LPIRVELQALEKDDFVHQPPGQTSLIRQCIA
jgi:ATP-dependent protease HslVU (ClpYQ) ATPase subunit